MASSPAYSPCEPAFGCNDTPANPVAVASHPASVSISAVNPAVWSAGANGCMSENPGSVIGTISAVAFSFMVQLPSGIMLRFSATSRSSNRLR